MVAAIHVRLQGPASILRDSDARRVPASAQPLVVALAAAGTSGIAREQVMDDLFVDEPLAKARRRLNTMVWRLREALTEGAANVRSTGAGDDRGGLLTLAGGWLSLDWNRVEIDVAPLFDLAHLHPARIGSLTTDELELCASVDVDRLVLGCDHDYVHRARERMRHAQTEACTQLASRSLDAREWMVSVHWARQGLSADPYREDLHQLIMRAFQAAGRPRDAHQQFEECRRLLEDDLGVSPLLTTVEAARRGPCRQTLPDESDDLSQLRNRLEAAINDCEEAVRSSRAVLGALTAAIDDNS